MSADEFSWHPLCLSNAIEASTSAGVKLHGKELVVWRDAAGHAHVWEDRCPHRGMRLSFGFVRGDHLACLYHGWQYDTAGQCRHIPAHPNLDVPATITVPSYKSREWAGIIWTSLDADAAVDEAANSLDVTPVRSIYVELPLDQAVTALSEHGLGAGTAVKQLETGLSLIKAEDDQLIAAFQPVSDSRTALHLVICGPALPEKQRHYALRIEALRHRLEAGVTADV